MTLGGLWHGASWRFVLWGIWHGIGLITDKLLKPVISRVPTWLAAGLGFFITFHFVVAGWILFRAPDLQRARTMVNRIVNAFQSEMIMHAIRANMLSFILIVAGFGLHWLPGSLKENIRGWFITAQWTVKVALVVVAVIIIIQFRTTDIVPFIYFRF